MIRFYGVSEKATAAAEHILAAAQQKRRQISGRKCDVNPNDAINMDVVLAAARSTAAVGRGNEVATSGRNFVNCP